MNFLKIEGLADVYPERIEGTSEWYCCKIATNCFCDLYEAEEIVKMGNTYEGMTCVLIHYPDGQVYYPFVAKENVYVDSPVYCNKSLYFTVTNFAENVLQVVAFSTEDFEQNVVCELSLDKVPNCYNLLLGVEPVMLYRLENRGESENNALKILWPEQKSFSMKDHQSFLFRDGDKMYFSEWFEEEEPDYNYHEQVIVRDWNTGEEIERFDGQLKRMPNGDVWVM